VLDAWRHIAGPKRALRRHAWKASLVAIVLEDAKQPRDREVSAIIAAVFDDAIYAEKAHQAWRRKHVELIAQMRAELLKRRIRFPTTALPVCAPSPGRR